MSEPLITPAPDEVSPESPVGEATQETPVAVPGESDSGGDTEEVVPAKRFNGLMSTFNKEQEARSAAEARAAALEERLAAAEAQLASPTPTQEAPVPDAPQSTDALQAQVAQLTELVGTLVNGRQEDSLSAVRQEVLREHPELEHFQDLIVANDPDEFRAVAQDVVSRVARLNGSGSVEPPAPVEGQEVGLQAAPVIAGGPPVADAPTNEVVAKALKERDWDTWMKARHGGADSDGLVLANQ